MSSAVSDFLLKYLHPSGFKSNILMTVVVVNSCLNLRPKKIVLYFRVVSLILNKSSLNNTCSFVMNRSFYSQEYWTQIMTQNVLHIRKYLFSELFALTFLVKSQSTEKIYFFNWNKLYLIFYKHLGWGLSPQSCLYFQDFWGSKLFNTNNAGLFESSFFLRESICPPSPSPFMFQEERI